MKRLTSSSALQSADFVILLDLKVAEQDELHLLKDTLKRAVLNCTVEEAMFAVLVNGDLQENVLVPLTSNREELCKRLEAHSSLNNKSALTELAQKASKHFSRAAARYLIIVGSTTPSRQAIRFLESLKTEKKVSIITASLDPACVRSYASLCGQEMAFLATDTAKFISAFDPLMLMKPSQYAVTVNVVACGVPVSLGNDITLEIHVRSLGVDVIPAGLTVIISESDYFKGLSVVFKEEISEEYSKVIGVLVGKREVSPLKLPNGLQYVVSHSSVKQKVHSYQNVVALSSEMFIKDLIGPSKPPIAQLPFYNILCFGGAGTGKSAFINTLLTSLHHGVVTYAPVGSAETGGVTKTFMKYPLSSMQHCEDVPVNLYDIWSLNENNFQEDMLSDVIQGYLPEGFQMKKKLKLTDNVLEAESTVYERRMHCVLLFVTPSVLDSPILPKLQDSISLCISNKLSPFMIVTRAQLIDTQNEHNFKQQLANTFSLPIDHIFTIDNYTIEREKDMMKDKKTLNMLRQFIQYCKEYHTLNRESLLGDYLKKYPESVDTVVPHQPDSQPVETLSPDPPSESTTLSAHLSSDIDETTNYPGQSIYSIIALSQKELAEVPDSIETCLYEVFTERWDDVELLYCDSVEHKRTLLQTEMKKYPGFLEVELLAIFVYTLEIIDVDSCIYHLLNKHLTSSKNRSQNLLKWRNYLHHFMNGLRKIKPQTIPYLYRGVNKDLTSLYPDKYKIDNKITFYGFTSTTPNFMVTTDFFRDTGTIFCFKNSQSGRDISFISAKQFEDEILFGPGSSFIIKDIKKKGTLTFIEMKQIGGSEKALRFETGIIWN